MERFLEAAPIAVGAGAVATAGGERKLSGGLLGGHEVEVKGLGFGLELDQSSVDKLKVRGI